LLKIAVYVVVPFAVQVAAVFTFEVIVAVAVSVWLELFLQTLFAVQVLPSADHVYVGVFQL
jgi:hypothetical protein